MLTRNANGISARDFLSAAKFYEGYSRFNEDTRMYETWDQSVERVMDMHQTKYSHLVGNPEFDQIINDITKAYKEKRLLGAQRALQFGGEQLLKHEMKLYNCVSGYANRAEFFNEFFYILLCGCGAGYSVQKHHVEQIPEIRPRTKRTVTYEIQDSIEGWADSVAVLLSSYFNGGGVYPKYEGKCVHFDAQKVRKKGSKISGGFLAPGPEPLMNALLKIEAILNERSLEGFLRPIDVYDINCHIADAVVSGGVRRAATICLFSKDDQEMLNAKVGNWRETNPQRGRSNNSMVLKRDEIQFEEFDSYMKYIREYGEPGYVFVDSYEHVFNPCVEIGMYAHFGDQSGWQGCNLVEQNGSMVKTPEDFFESCRIASAVATLQAGYTNFKYVSEITKKIFEREALIGVSVTGWMNSPDVLLNPEVLEKGAAIVLETNKRVAKLIGINPAARTTCVKPSGNASVLLGTSPASQGEHSERHIRITQMNKQSPIAQAMLETNPYMVEESVWSANNTDYVIMWPIVAPKGSLFKKDLQGVKFLEYVKLIQTHWVNAGTDVGLCVDPNLRHNVSNTTMVSEDDWDKVSKYVFENKDYFTGISFISASGDKDYPQAPFTAVLTPKEIVSKYGDAALFASGLIVDAIHGFRDLWEACDVIKYGTEMEGETRDNREAWIRRFTKFADNFFDGDLQKTEYCLKDVALLHKWNKIQQTITEIDFRDVFKEQLEIDIDTTGAQACSPTQGCEI